MSVHDSTSGTLVKFLIAAIVAWLLTGCAAVVSDAAHRKFEARTEPFAVTVYPVHVVRGKAIDHDADLAGRLAGFLEAENLARPVVAERKIDVPEISP